LHCIEIVNINYVVTLPKKLKPEIPSEKLQIRKVYETDGRTRESLTQNSLSSKQPEWMQMRLTDKLHFGETMATILFYLIVFSGGNFFEI
jgi:hypothetical protein